MLWFILFLLLILWTVRFGFDAGGAVLSASMVAGWLVWLGFLFTKRRRSAP